MPAPHRTTALALCLATLFAAALGGCASAAVSPPGELRVIVQFKRSVSPVDPDILRRLSVVSGTSVRVSAAVSDTEAAYWLNCTPKDPLCHDAMGRLVIEPIVGNVQPDRYRYPTDPPR